MKLFETSWIYVKNKQQETILHSTYFVQVFDSFSPHSSRSKKENHICDIKNSNSRSSAKPYPLWRCFICKANMPPKNSINGFALFMNDQRDVLKRQGANCGGQALAMTCGPLWKALPDGVRKEYERKAKEIKAKQKGSDGDMGRLDCVGNIIGLHKDPAEEARMRRKRDREQTVSEWKGKDLTKELFYLVNFQDLCELTDGDNTVEREWLPREGAVLEFSLEQGIIRHWHRFICPGPIPKGYKYTCMQRSEQTHKIPIEDFEQDCNNYSLMWKEIKQLMKNGRQKDVYPPLYCLASEYQKNKYLMDWMWQMGDEGSAPDNPLGNVYSLEDLVVDLISHSGFSDSVASCQITAKLDGYFWDYIPGTQCSWHEEQDTKHCALGFVRRYAYTISDIVAQLYGITLTEKHVPTRSNIEPVGIILPPDAVPVSRAWEQRRQAAQRSNRKIQSSQPSKASAPDAGSDEEGDFSKPSPDTMEKLRSPVMSSLMVGPQRGKPYGYEPPPLPPSRDMSDDDWPELAGASKLAASSQRQEDMLVQKSSLGSTTDARKIASVWGSSSSMSATVTPPPGFDALPGFGVRPIGRGAGLAPRGRGAPPLPVGRGRALPLSADAWVPPVGRGTTPWLAAGRGMAPSPFGRDYTSSGDGQAR